MGEESLAAAEETQRRPGAGGRQIGGSFLGGRWETRGKANRSIRERGGLEWRLELQSDAVWFVVL